MVRPNQHQNPGGNNTIWVILPILPSSQECEEQGLVQGGRSWGLIPAKHSLVALFSDPRKTLPQGSQWLSLLKGNSLTCYIFLVSVCANAGLCV